MIMLWFFIICLGINLSSAQQFYDETKCSSGSNYPGTRYTCNSSRDSCQTFVVYRASQELQTVSKIARLFGKDPTELLTLINVTSSSKILEADKEVLIPIFCSCSGQFFQANFSYVAPKTTTLTEISCGVFQGLVKSITLLEENHSQENNIKVGSVLHVPLRCACPDHFSTNAGVKYLVTYPFVQGDTKEKLSRKFNISFADLLETNHLEPLSTVFPSTSVLVPLKGEPSINFDIPVSDPPVPTFLPTFPVKHPISSKQVKILFIAGLAVGFCLVIIAILACGLYVKVFNKWKSEPFRFSIPRSSMASCSTPIGSPITRSSTNSCLSPDLLVGIKYSLCNYNIDDVTRATKDFSEDTRIGANVYKGIVDNVRLTIEQTRFEDTRQAIDIHSRINHVNIVKLIGVCYVENDFSWSYLVFEFPINGCLRDCLSNFCTSLRWHRRTQIAFDIATALHYLYYCMVPPCTHLRLSSRNIFLTQNWRAKVAFYGSTTDIGTSRENENDEVWNEPENPEKGLSTAKVDIFAFGIILLELISATEDIDGKLLRESIGFLTAGASEGGCFEQLRNFMDPCLKGDYPLAEALCLAVLAKSCVEDDPLHRPSMDDILKVIARML